MSDSVDRVEADRFAAALAAAEPAEYAGLLAALDPGELSHRGRIDLLIAVARHRDWLDACEHRVLAALAADQPAPADRDPVAAGLDKQYLREEVACALRVSAQTAAHRLTLAQELARRLPQTLGALEHAALSGPMARRLAETLIPLDQTTATRVQRRVLPRAAGQTFTQFTQTLRRAVLTEDPHGQTARHHAALADRAVRHWPSENGMGELHATLRADHAAACYAALTDAAGHPAGPGDDRTLDQRRADALYHLLTGQAAADQPTHTDTDTDTELAADTELAPADRRARRQARRAQRRQARRRAPHVHVTVALSTLLGLDQQPGELAGHGPIPAELARHIAADPTGTWHRLVTDHHGHLLDYGHTRYRPPTTLINHIHARDLTCRMPHCNRPATTCDIDHVTAWADGGTTNPANLHSLCSRDHHLKHEAGWTTHRLPDGTTRWTTPTGHTYDKPPERLPLDTTLTRASNPKPPGDPDPPAD